jgi:hypothetical protein
MNELITLLVGAGLQLRVFHWQTRSYAEHAALGVLYDKVSEVTDELVESIQGTEEPRITFSQGGFTLVDYTSKQDVLIYLQDFIESIRERRTDEQTEIQNRLDDLIAATERSCYLVGML